MGVSESLAAIGIRKDEDYAALKECATFQDEFKLVRKAYLKRCLATHPDKGGDEQDFRRVNESFEFLKCIYETGKAKSFTTATSRSAGHRHDAADAAIAATNKKTNKKQIAAKKTAKP